MLETKSVTLQQSAHFCLESIDLLIKEGEIVSLIGPNGSGKSTLLRIISRLLKADAGTVLLDGEEITRLKSTIVAQKLAMLPQMQDHQLDVTVRELVAFGRHPYRTGYGGMTSTDEEVIEWALEVTKLQAYRNRVLTSLSGGERQRAWIAMAIAQRPKVLLLDEPTTYLDISHQLEVMELVTQLNKTFNMTVIMVLHDINQAAQYADRMIVLKNGTIQYDGLPQCVLCREMFQSIFEIDAAIYEEKGKPFFTPVRLKQTACLVGE